MKQLKQFFLAVVLLLGSVGSVYADVYVPMDPGAPGVFNTSWSIDGELESDASTHFAGDYFYDVFVFNVPDAQVISFSISAFRFGVDLLSAPNSGYAVVNYADFGLRAMGGATTPYAMSGGPLTLTSGTYGLIIGGHYLVDGGTFVGSITGIAVAAVPEPASWLLLLVGLGALTVVVRQRKQSA